jgi:hypothetical protein
VPSLTIRDATELAESGKLTNAAPAAGAVSGLADKGRELLPLFASFCPLTIYLPANRGGRGYAIHPLGITFQVGTNGIAVGAGGGAPPMQGIGVGQCR